MIALRAIALSLAGISLFSLGNAVAQLSSGWSEVPSHWWSAAPALGLVLPIAIAFAPRVLRRVS